ncbi:hypothetical protein Cni_G11165 [Canna indica]|uniref:Cytochrome P450 86B1 n=1 Tax=Canna indica TaxID=4628 RepID=A0AAQ3QAK4_9LILI|nr:hypothetical protein Cni_G11165 [Canna indica]
MIMASIAAAVVAAGTKASEHLCASDLAFAVLGLFACSAAMQRLTSKGPMIWPVLGILPTLFFHLADIYEWVTRAAARSGGTFPFRGIWFANYSGVITVDPAAIQYMLKTRFANFPKGKYYRERFAELLGDGIFNADDQPWRDQRRAATAEMHSARFAEYSACTIADLVHRKLLALLRKVAATGESVDLQEVFLRFTFDNICTAAFGVDPGCLSVDLPTVPFAKAFEEATELSLFRFIVPPFVWKMMRHFDVGTEQRLKAAVRVVHNFAEETVVNRRTEFENSKGSRFADRSDLLSRLIESETVMDDDDDHTGSMKAKYSNKFLKDFCTSFILAGRDTSSVALAWFFWLLSKHRHVEERILREISAVIKSRHEDETTHALDGVVFTVDDLKRMEYLQAAISESLRLYPSVPIDFKEALEDDVFPDGTVVKKGARVIYSIYSMARMESIWGKDCREFKPQRWIKDGVFVTESQFKYAVFNAGPRLCIGKKFAYVQMKMVAAAILLRYKVKVVEGQKVAPKVTTTLYMKNGLEVTFEKREGLLAAD